MAESSQAPRRAALALLGAVMDDGRLLSDVLAQVMADLSPQGRARAQRLALEVLRTTTRADHLLAPFLRKPPPLFVRNTLRLATYEMLADGAAAHGVVNDAVGLVRGNRKSTHMAGLVNAVLRKVAAAGPEAWQAAPMQKLPKWLRGRLLKAYGEARVAGFEVAHEQGAPTDLTPKTGDAGALAAVVGGTALPTGSVRLDRSTRLTGLDGYDEGDWWVQDAAAALPARLLAVQPGETVLDLCAAPGGKTMQLAAPGAEVTALDVSADRVRRLSENLTRTRLLARIEVADVLTWATDQTFDAVLLDAPCSATGTIRRHPDLVFAKDGKGLRDLFALQSSMLDKASALVRPGGRMVFCTCSLLPEEGERQVTAFLDRTPGFSVQIADAPWIEDGWKSPQGGLRLLPDFWPDRGGMDGFYMVCLHKAA